MPQRHLIGATLVAITLAFCACAGCPAIPGPTDGGEAIPEASQDNIHCYKPTASGPKITQIKYQGQAPNQPYILRFLVSWEDPDQNLKGGTFQFSVGDTPLFRRGFPIDIEGLDKAKGTIELPLILDKSMLEGKQSLQIELAIWDAEGNGGNQPRLVLEWQR